MRQTFYTCFRTLWIPCYSFFGWSEVKVNDRVNCWEGWRFEAGRLSCSHFFSIWSQSDRWKIRKFWGVCKQCVQIELDVVLPFEIAWCPPKHCPSYIHWKTILLLNLKLVCQNLTEFHHCIWCICRRHSGCYFWLPFQRFWPPFSLYLLNFIGPLFHHFFTKLFCPFSQQPLLRLFSPHLSRLFFERFPYGHKGFSNHTRPDPFACGGSSQRVRQRILPIRSSDSSSYISRRNLLFFDHDAQRL